MTNIGVGGDRLIQWAVDVRIRTALVVTGASAHLQITYNSHSDIATWINPTNPNAPNAHVIGVLINIDTGATLTRMELGGSVDMLQSDTYRDQFLTIDAATGQVHIVSARSGHQSIVAYNESLPTTIVAVTVGVIDALTHRLVAGLLTAGSSATRPQDEAVGFFDTASGGVVRLVALPNSMTIAEHVAGLSVSRVTTQPSAVLLSADGMRTFIFDTGRTMTAVDTRNGRILFARKLPFVVQNPVYDGRAGRIFALANTSNTVAGDFRQPPTTGGLVMLRSDDGSLLGMLQVGNASSTLAVDHLTGCVFVADANRGTVSMLDGTRGRLLHRTAIVGATGPLALDERGHQLFLLSHRASNDLIAVLDTRTGLLNRSIPIRGDVEGIQVDPTTGHLLVLISSPVVSTARDGWRWVPKWLRSRIPGIPGSPHPQMLGSGTSYAYSILTLSPDG